MQMPLPKSRSPVKTNLKSPARRNPHLDRLSSPTRASISAGRNSPVARRLDFTKGSPLGLGAKSRSNGINGLSRSRRGDTGVEEEDDDEEHEHGDQSLAEVMDDALEMVGAMDDNPAAEHDEEEPLVRRWAPEMKKPPRPKGLPRARARTSTEEPLVFDGADSEPELAHGVGSEQEDEDQRQQQEEEGEEGEELEEAQPARPERRRPPRTDSSNSPRAGPASTKRGPAKRAKDLGDGQQDEAVDDADEQLRPHKRRRAEASAAGRRGPGARPRGRPKAAEGKPAKKGPRTGTGRRPGRPPAKPAEESGETSFMALQRGPPMPKSRGLVSFRRDADHVLQTRSGRHSYRPVDFWRGEEVVLGEEERDDNFYHDHGFVLPTIKEVIRVPESTLPSKRAPRSRTRSNTKAKAEARFVEEDEQLEAWEVSPGTVAGEVVLWEPEHELHPPAEDEPVNIVEEQVAISADAVQTKDIRDTTFRFAKTLTMPFMGAGIVDLPPGAEKRPKNSRKMHMVFFVHYGKVMVTINETQFRISAGGMWFVPRGKFPWFPPPACLSVCLSVCPLIFFLQILWSSSR